MAKAPYILIFDRNSLTGPPRKHRFRDWSINTSPDRGHPNIQAFPAASFDYFRRTLALYFSWDGGSRPSTYGWFRFLNDAARISDLDGLSSYRDTSCVNIINPDDLVSLVAAPDEQAIQDLMASMTSNPTKGAYIDAIGGALQNRSLPQNSVAWSEQDLTTASNAILIKIEGDNEMWIRESDNRGAPGYLRELFNEPYWSNWQAYVMGGDRLGDNDQQEQDIEGGSYPQRAGIKGLFGQDSLGNFYDDHSMRIELLDPTENIFTSTTYGYYNAFFDEISNNANVKEIYIPNFYLVSSILAKGFDPSYPTLYNPPTQAGDGAIDAMTSTWATSANRVKQLLEAAVAPHTPVSTTSPGTDILSTGTPVTINDIQALPQTPNSLLSRFVRKDFTDSELSTTLEANRHIGLTARMVKAQEVTQTSIVSEMNVRDTIFPYSINVEFTPPGYNNSLEPEIVTYLRGDGNDSSETFNNFVLYEIMKANILDYKNIDSGYSDPDQPTAGGMAANNKLYSRLAISGRTSLNDDSKIKDQYGEFIGFDWTTGHSNWMNNSKPTATNPYSLRTIDFANMFKNIYQQQDSNFYGSGSNYNGFVGQTSEYNVVDGKGIIVGQRFVGVSPQDEWAQWTLNEFHYNGFAADGDPDVPAEFYTDLASFTTEKMRTYRDMISARAAFNEPLVYKLDKHEVLADGSVVPEPIQSIYIPKTGDSVKYRDTQVFSGKRYKYKIYSYNLVVGNTYRYEDPQVFPSIQEPYKSCLGSLLGFNRGSNPDGVDIDITAGTWAPWDAAYISDNVNEGERSILVSNIVNFSELTVQVGSTGPTTVRFIEANPDYWASGTSYYLDIATQNVTPAMIAGNPDLIQSVEHHSNKLMHTSLATNSAYQADQLAEQIESALNSATSAGGWKVRFLEDANYADYADQARGGRFVIAQRSAILNPKGFNLAHMLSWAQEYIDLQLTSTASGGDTGLPNNFLELFDMAGSPAGVQQVSQNSGPATSSKHYVFLFGSGAHSLNPALPWEQENSANPFGTATVKVENRKSIKIVELQVGETNPVAVADLPPQFPNVDIYPLRGINNKIKILLNETNHTDSYIPIIINESDQQIFEDIRISQGREPDEGVVFGSDDSKLTFEIYRTDHRPSSYTDFAGHRVHNLHTITPLGLDCESASVVDSIKPNTVYYYCFRTIDKNGYMSNPSPVLRVQLIDDNGRIYPVIEPYTIKPQESRKTEKSFKRYLEIDTSLEEKSIDLGSSPDLTSAGSLLFPPNVTVGDTIWSPKYTFKVRIISKDTGRKLDLNINFNMERIPNPKLQGN